MILELDCGNSLIKWRVLGASGAVEAFGSVRDGVRELHAQLPSGRVQAIRMVSVRGEAETAALAVMLERAFKVAVRVAQPAPMLAGVRNGYGDYRRLGMDRWLALVAGWKRAGRAVLVIDLGTAVTVDLVTDDGLHLGGYIGPGLTLMRRGLLSHTSRIRYEEQDILDASLSPGCDTHDAVEHGCRLMLQGFVLEQMRRAVALLGEGYAVLVTGGDAGLLDGVLPEGSHVRDLVFEGLAIACPMSVEEGCV